MAKSEKICVAQIGAAHGLKGEVRLKPFTEDAATLSDYRSFTDESGRRAFTLVSARPSKGLLIARFEDIATREAAEALRHLRLYIDRTQLPPTEDEEFYHADLIGLDAVGPGNKPLGTVSALYDFGAGDMLEITGGDGDIQLYPFTQEAVPVIDIPAGRVEIVPPPETSERSDEDKADR